MDKIGDEMVKIRKLVDKVVQEWAIIRDVLIEGCQLMEPCADVSNLQIRETELWVELKVDEAYEQEEYLRLRNILNDILNTKNKKEPIASVLFMLVQN